MKFPKPAYAPSQKLLPGAVVEYEQHGKPILAAIRGERRNKWLVVNERGQELELPSERLTLLPEAVPGARTSLEAIGAFLGETAEGAAALAESLDLEDLWQVVSETTAELPVMELTEIAFGRDSLLNRTAMRRALLRDEVYFKRKKSGFEPRPASVVAELKVRAEVEIRRARERAELLAALVARARGEARELPSNVSLIENLAAGQTEQVKEATDLVNTAFGELGLPLGGRPADRAFDILVRAGHFSEDQDLTLFRFGRRMSFAAAVEAEALELVASVARQSDASRRDCRSVELVTIDSETTHDIDDALSLEQTEEGWRVGIHITDVAAVIPEQGRLMEEVQARGTSIYTPDYRIPMLPLALSEGALSLRCGEVRGATSFFIEIDREYRVRRRSIERTTIEVTAQLTYEGVDELLFGESVGEAARFAPLLRTLWDVACACEARRLAAGALQFSRRELVASVAPQGKVTVQEVVEDTPARKLVGELMILANETAALFAKENTVPLIFRAQPEPDVVVAAQGLHVPEGPAREYIQRGCLKRSTTGVTPAPHSALGLEAYTQVTSPIRRAADLLNQRQLNSFLLSGRPRYSAAELAELSAGLEPVLDEASYIQRTRNRYWLLRFLVQENIRELPATIVRVDTAKPLAELEVIYSIYSFNPRPGDDLRKRIGERIRLRIEEIDPRREVFILVEASP